MAKGFKTGGRKAGAPNRVMVDVRALANTYTAEAVTTLVDRMRHGGEQVRLAASRELLDPPLVARHCMPISGPRWKRSGAARRK